MAEKDDSEIERLPFESLVLLHQEIGKHIKAFKNTGAKKQKLKPDLEITRSGKNKPTRQVLFEGDPIPPDTAMRDCKEFRQKFPSLKIAQLDPLFALPQKLIEAISKTVELKDWFSKEELQFEKALAAFSERHKSFGITENFFVWDNLIRPMELDSKDLATLSIVPGNNITPESIAANIAPAIKVRANSSTMMEAYCGWLTTHRPYIDERDQIRNRRKCLGLRVSFLTTWDRTADTEFQEFLAKWRLCGLQSWDIPIPQGQDLAGGLFPSNVQSSLGMINISIPDTFATPARFPINDSIENAARVQRADHLRDWYRVLDRKGQSKGFLFYQRMFRLNFYRNVALASRYGDRMKRHAASFDHAFAKFFCCSDESVRQLRLEMQKRLRKK